MHGRLLSNAHSSCTKDTLACRLHGIKCSFFFFFVSIYLAYTPLLHNKSTLLLPSARPLTIVFSSFPLFLCLHPFSLCLAPAREQATIITSTVLSCSTAVLSSSSRIVSLPFRLIFFFFLSPCCCASFCY